MVYYIHEVIIAEFKDLVISQDHRWNLEPFYRKMNDVHAAVQSFASTESVSLASVENAMENIHSSISQFFVTEEGVRDCK